MAILTKFFGDLVELMNNNSHELSPPGGLVSPSGGFVTLLCDQGQTETTYSTYHERVFQIQASIIFECYVSTSSLCKYKLFVCICTNILMVRMKFGIIRYFI